MSQINFFMLADDERAFVEMLRSRDDTTIVDPKALGRVAKSEETLVLLNPALPCKKRPELFHDPFIDFTRCHRKGRVLVSGRLYAKIGWLKKKEDNVTFQRWYGALARWIRTNSERHEGIWWIAPEAARFFRAGNYFSYGGGPPMDRDGKTENQAKRR